MTQLDRLPSVVHDSTPHMTCMFTRAPLAHGSAPARGGGRVPDGVVGAAGWPGRRGSRPFSVVKSTGSNATGHADAGVDVSVTVAVEP